MYVDPKGHVWSIRQENATCCRPVKRRCAAVSSHNPRLPAPHASDGAGDTFQNCHSEKGKIIPLSTVINWFLKTRSLVLRQWSDKDDLWDDEEFNAMQSFGNPKEALY